MPSVLDRDETDYRDYEESYTCEEKASRKEPDGDRDNYGGQEDDKGPHDKCYDQNSNYKKNYQTDESRNNLQGPLS